MNQPKTQPTRPPQSSAGALRAAHLLRDIVAREGMLPFPKHLALIIDRETGVAELLEAAKQVYEFHLSTAQKFHPTGKALEQAIAKCEQSGEGGYYDTLPQNGSSE